MIVRYINVHLIIIIIIIILLEARRAYGLCQLGRNTCLMLADYFPVL